MSEASNARVFMRGSGVQGTAASYGKHVTLSAECLRQNISKQLAPCITL